jgi:hypothetical protein
MSADINIVVFNYNFLKELQRERDLLASDIKFKFKGFKQPNTYTSLYRNLDSITTTHPAATLPAKARKCMYGDYSEIEELLITNNNFPFYNEFHVYNITGTIRIVEKVRLNDLNDNFYTEEIKRYKTLLTRVFTQYIKDWNAYKKDMDECYVQSCYVDDYYNCNDDDLNI